jgi:hypothetical protein
MATTARPAAAVTPTATAVFQRPPPARGPPRRPAATRWTQPHAHIGRRCPADRSTAPCAIPGGAGGALDRKIPASSRLLFPFRCRVAWHLASQRFRGSGVTRRAVFGRARARSVRRQAGLLACGLYVKRDVFFPGGHTRAGLRKTGGNDPVRPVPGGTAPARYANRSGPTQNCAC